MLASIPAIQPVSNDDLTRMASGFGRRIDPIYKTKKFHYGMDFSAPIGTPVYATGNGTVAKIKKSRSKKDYGNYILINHGYDYESFYAHLDKVLVSKGKKVKRGDLIGYVGNTGKSTAPHLHYEVRYKKQKINPLNFYHNDLTPEEYEKRLEQIEDVKSREVKSTKIEEEEKGLALPIPGTKAASELTEQYNEQNDDEETETLSFVSELEQGQTQNSENDVTIIGIIAGIIAAVVIIGVVLKLKKK